MTKRSEKLYLVLSRSSGRYVIDATDFGIHYGPISQAILWTAKDVKLLKGYRPDGLDLIAVPAPKPRRL